jgi:hypothetical protein
MYAGNNKRKMGITTTNNRNNNTNSHRCLLPHLARKKA